MLSPTRFCQHIKIDIAATGAVIAAASGLGYRILEMFVLNTTGTTTIQFADGATALTGVMTLAAGTPLVLPFSGEPWLIISQGNAFNFTLGASTQVSGHIGYVTYG